MKSSSIYSVITVLTLVLFSCGQATISGKNHKGNVINEPDNCDSPDAALECCFVNMPSSLSARMNISSPGEKGEQLIIRGTIFKADGKTPNKGVILYAYHTDDEGYYSKSGNEKGAQRWHGRLHGWCKTDEKGYYEIHSIRPARYPDNTMPAHIHSAVKTSNGKMSWISDFVFEDDSLVNDRYKANVREMGGTGVVRVQKNQENVWTGIRDIVLSF